MVKFLSDRILVLLDFYVIRMESPYTAHITAVNLIKELFFHQMYLVKFVSANTIHQNFKFSPSNLERCEIAFMQQHDQAMGYRPAPYARNVKAKTG